MKTQQAVVGLQAIALHDRVRMPERVGGEAEQSADVVFTLYFLHPV